MVVIVLGVAVIAAFSYHFTMLLLYVGVLFVPLAAFLCAWAARKRGMNAQHYAITGMVCSILLFLPWIYLMVSLLGKSVSATLVRAGYIFLYFVWLFGLVCMTFVVLLTFDLDFATEPTTRTENYVENILFAFLIISGILWFLSLVLLKLDVWVKYCSKEIELRESLVPAFGYLQPFTLALGCFVSFTAIVVYLEIPLYEGLLPILPI